MVITNMYTTSNENIYHVIANDDDINISFIRNEKIQVIKTSEIIDAIISGNEKITIH